MVNLTGAEAEKPEDLTRVSETGLSLVNSSHKSIVQLNSVCQSLKQPTAKSIRKLSPTGFNSFSQSSKGCLETACAYPAENEVVAEATQWEQRIEDILVASEALKQSESFLSDFNGSCDEDTAQQLEPGKTPGSSPDVIQATPLEVNGLSGRKKSKKHSSSNSNEASNIGDGSDSEILDMHCMGLPIKKWKKLRKNSVNLDEGEPTVKTSLQEAEPKSASNSELEEENKIVRKKRSKKHKTNKSRKRGTDDEESPKSEHQKRAKRRSEDQEDTDQASTPIKPKKRRLSRDVEADHSYEDPSDCDAALEVFLGLGNFKRDFKVPRLHKIVDRASKPTADQREEIALRGIEVKTAKFSSAEDRQIQENWRHFIQVFRLKDQPQKFFCLHAKRVNPEAKRTFLFYLARGFPNRTPYSVFKRFKLLMDRLTKGRFSQEEDEFILSAIEGKPKIPITEVAKHLHRSLGAVSCRISKLQTTYSRKIKWSGRNAASYIKYLLEATDLDEKDIGLLKNRQITAEEWSKLSEKLDNVPVRILKPVWLNFLHPALFMPGNSCDLGKIKWKLAKRLHKNNETEWSCVDWTKYVARFEGFTSLKLYTMLKQLIKTHVPERKQANLARSLKHLMKQKLRIAAQPLKLLYKIKYRNGEIQDTRPSDL